MVPFKKSRKQNEISSRPSFSSKRKGEGGAGLWGPRSWTRWGLCGATAAAASAGREAPRARLRRLGVSSRVPTAPKITHTSGAVGRAAPAVWFYNPLLISRRWHASDPCVHFAHGPSPTAPSPFWRCLSRAGRLGSRHHPTPRGGERDANPRPPLWDPSERHQAPGCPRGDPTATP